MSALAPGGRQARVLADGWVVTLRNLRRLTRIPELGVLAIVQSVMFLLLFSYVFGDAIPVPGGDYRGFLMAGIFTQTVAFGVGATAVGLADDLHKGLIDRFRSLPMARSAVLSGRTAADLIQNVLIVVVMSGCGLLVGWRLHRGLTMALAAFGLILLFGFAMSWIGALIGLCVTTVEAANTAGVVWLFPLTFVSDVFVPVRSLPGWLRPVAEWNPVSTTARAARELFGNPTGDVPGQPAPHDFPMQHPALASLLCSALVLAVFVPLSVHRYRTVSAR
ncbi:ABC transporter permease [Streptacidiphilus sp. EB129]|uniref:ABC transporter permease n=1 Tax=Streptacidiphilus sp. EB129 TaxID=3156262 RepID=UPI00351846B6